MIFTPIIKLDSSKFHITWINHNRLTRWSGGGDIILIYGYAFGTAVYALMDGVE